MNKYVYEQKNENEKMLLKTPERLDQTSRRKRDLKRKHSLMPYVKARLDVFSGVTKKKNEFTSEDYSTLQEDRHLTSSHRIQNQHINTGATLPPTRRSSR